MDFNSRELQIAVSVLTAGAIAVGAVSLQNHQEREAQLPRRETATEVLRARSLENCPEKDASKAEQNYSSRFAEAMDIAEVSDLETIVEKGTTICLDSRLSQQKGDRNRILGVYYPEQNILSLYDNAHVAQPNLGIGAKTFSRGMIEKFSSNFKDGSL